MGGIHGACRNAYHEKEIITLKHKLVEAAIRHLPPSASQLQLLDINSEASAVMGETRHDIVATAASGDSQSWEFEDARFDAVVALDYILNTPFLNKVLAVLRPGGRLIVVQSQGEIKESIGRTLEANGFTRILIESVENVSSGVLIRGERPHATDDTLQRIESVAYHDSEQLDLTNFKGRYVHLLILQTPNKPVWRMERGEPIEWQAVGLADEDHPALLGFSSLPRAVRFMQSAVLNGTLTGINKVGKFSKDTASTWTHTILINPAQAVLDNGQIVFIPVDPATAEAADE